MNGKKIGYIRISTTDQNHARQLAGLQFDRVFIDEYTGKVLDRPAFIEMMKYVRDGDHVYVHSMDRLARNLLDLRKTVKILTEQKISIHFIKENISFTGDDSSMSMLLLSIMGAFAEFELSLIRDRQQEGIKLARLRGVYPGRKKLLTEDQVVALKQMAAQGIKKTKIAETFHMSREAVYKYLKENK